MSRNCESPKGTLVIDLSTKNKEIISQAAAMEQIDLNDYIVNQLLLNSLRVIFGSGNVTSDDIRNIDNIIKILPHQTKICLMRFRCIMKPLKN